MCYAQHDKYREFAVAGDVSPHGLLGAPSAHILLQQRNVQLMEKKELKRKEFISHKEKAGSTKHTSLYTDIYASPLHGAVPAVILP